MRRTLPVFHEATQPNARAGLHALKQVLDTYFGGAVYEALAAHLTRKDTALTDEQTVRASRSSSTKRNVKGTDMKTSSNSRESIQDCISTEKGVVIDAIYVQDEHSQKLTDRAELDELAAAVTEAAHLRLRSAKE